MSGFWNKIVRPVMFALDAERAHELGMSALRNGLARPFYSEEVFPELETEVFGLRFKNPLGIAAGFDKNGTVVEQLASLGFGFVEVGTVTLKPQPGNERPRMFRLPADNALINRLGFNNDGAEAVADRLAKIKRRCIVGVNIGKNRDVAIADAVENYVRTYDIVHPVADYITVNISSPNTPNLRELQKGESLDELLSALTERNAEEARKPLLVKIAPDLNDAEIRAVVEKCMQYGIDGIIAANTTISRQGLQTKEVEAIGAGGLSGRPLTMRSTEVVRRIYEFSDGKLPIVGVGGIFDANDAFEKFAAGASLVQAYTGFVYVGPTFAADVCRGLAKCLRDNGFRSIGDAVGSSVSTR
ncbi:MAG: quinone-dependent dihydroorotate dehydrogenase [Acidobacteriota bacterium]|nr:MAG: quinone-dependent dihydroorotate dehydrogenase [Acidobacteriota bacterium]